MKNQHQIIIDYHWKCDQGIEIAEARIFEMMNEGYLMGDLQTSVSYGKDIVPEEDEDDGLSYSGFWGIKKTVVRNLDN
jgi:hypothetical protein